MHQKIHIIQFRAMKEFAHNLYIHVPFCMSKCNYCAFFSRACGKPDWDDYANKICTEIKNWANKLGPVQIPTIFFGGGTPSLMPVYVFDKIMNTVRQSFNTDNCVELTLESNPGTLDRQKLIDFYNAGMTRLSVGVQSFNDDKLKFLGRRHNAQDALTLVHNAQNIGVRVSADFIYGLPGEGVIDVIETCKKINELGLGHCSLYELTIEPDTPFGKMNLQMPDNDTMAQMYNAISEYLNLPRYEVSNYAAPGQECAHNQNIWDGAPYIGLGMGAAGRILLDGVWYEQMGDYQKFEKMSGTDRAIEKLITGMRTIRGCQLTDDVKNVTNIDWVNQNTDLVKIQNNRICATESGMLILDEIMINLVK